MKPWRCKVVRWSVRLIIFLSLVASGLLRYPSAQLYANRQCRRKATFSVAVIAGVVVITPRKLDEHARLVAYGPRIMTWRQQHDIVPREVLLRTIVHDDAKRSRKHERHVGQLTAIGSCVVFQVIRPLRAHSKSYTCHGNALESNCLLFYLSVLIVLYRIKIAFLHARKVAHGGLLPWRGCFYNLKV